MSNNNYKINPCKSCRQNYDLTDINSINQCCYNTLAAFEGKTSLNSFRNSPEVMNCQKCILFFHFHDQIQGIHMNHYISSLDIL